MKVQGNDSYESSLSPRASRSALSCSRPVILLFWINALRPMRLTRVLPTSTSTWEAQASSNVTPVSEVRISIRFGGKPN